MDIVVENVSELTRKMTVTLPGEEVGRELGAIYKKMQKEVKIRGFRQGKVPMTVVEKNFKEQAQGEAGEKLVQATYFEAIEQKKLDPVVHPEIVEHSFNEDGTFTYVAMVDTKPVFELGDYRGIVIERPVTTVSDAAVDVEIEQLRREHAVLKSAEDDHAITKDDIAIVDFQGFHEGKAMPQVHNENYSVDVGEGRLGEEFESKLIGLKKGDKTLYTIDFPAEYQNPLLAGKSVEFKVDIKDVKVRLKPELDDEFAKDVSEDYQTLDDLRGGVRKRLQKSKDKAMAGDLDDRIMHNLLDLHDFAVPHRLVFFEIEEMIKQIVSNLERSNLTLESVGLKREELAEKNKDVAEKRVRGDFILKAIGEKEEITLADEDIERGYQRIAKQYNMSLADVKSYFQRREEILPFMHELLNEKILAFLRDTVQIVENTEETEPAAAE